jgi:hypothetical protein
VQGGLPPHPRCFVEQGCCVVVWRSVLLVLLVSVLASFSVDGTLVVSQSAARVPFEQVSGLLG